MKVACLFEQSGTFKNAFLKNGSAAFDFDISNSFGCTDFVIDLFKKIDSSDLGFLDSYDLALAFFPCTWFSDYNQLIYSRKWFGFSKMSDTQIDDYIIKRKSDYCLAAERILKLVELCPIPLIIENPSSVFIRQLLGVPDLAHYRSDYGDCFRKPTYYYCFNGVCILPLDYIPCSELKYIEHTRSKIERSLISPIYAENFVNHIQFNLFHSSLQNI